MSQNNEQGLQVNNSNEQTNKQNTLLKGRLYYKKGNTTLEVSKQVENIREFCMLVLEEEEKIKDYSLFAISMPDGKKYPWNGGMADLFTDFAILQEFEENGLHYHLEKIREEDDNLIYLVKYERIVKINEEYPAETIGELCRFITEAKKLWGDPTKVFFPDGTEYFWGGYGSWLSEQFFQGAISEEEVVEMLQKHNLKTLNIALNEINDTEKIIDIHKKELKMLEQRRAEHLLDIEKWMDKLLELKINYKELQRKEDENNEK